MSKEYTTELILVPAEMQPVSIRTIRCDKCGRVIDADDPPEDNEDLYTQELVILLNPELCVNSRIKYDLCRTCLIPIWEKICEALGIDPDDEHKIGDDYDND